MATRTTKGRELAERLNPAIGSTREITETCSLICRHATTHHAYCEAECNRSLSAWEEIRMDGLERRITQLVESLPHTDAGPFGVTFSGDPRGCTVKITAPAPWDSLYDSWGRDGICVPQR